MNEWVKLIVTGTLSAVVNGVVTFLLVRRLVKGLEKVEERIVKGGKSEKDNLLNNGTTG